MSVTAEDLRSGNLSQRHCKNEIVAVFIPQLLAQLDAAFAHERRGSSTLYIGIYLWHGLLTTLSRWRCRRVVGLNMCMYACIYMYMYIYIYIGLILTLNPSSAARAA